MQDVKQNTKKRGLNWFIVLLIIIVGYGGSVVIEQQYKLSALDDDMVGAQERLEAAKQENAQLRDEYNKLGDVEYIEKLAREELGMTRQGEMPYIYADK